MAQTQRIGKTATSVSTDDDGYTRVIYHSTVVVKFNDKRIILNTGGWKTATTKLRMNQTANQFQLGYTVVQRDDEWSVICDSRMRPIKGTLTINFDGDKVELARA